MLEKAELSELIGLLEERLRVIGDVGMRERDPEGQLEKLKEVSEAIVAFHAAHRPRIQPRLNHFLENCSYQKAIDWASDELAKQ